MDVAHGFYNYFILANGMAITALVLSIYGLKRRTANKLK